MKRFVVLLVVLPLLSGCFLFSSAVQIGHGIVSGIGIAVGDAHDHAKSP